MNSGIETLPSPAETSQASSTPPPRWRKPAMIAVLVVCAALFIALLILVRTVHRSSVRPPAATHASSSSFVRLNGKTEAVRARSILAPVLAGQQVGILTVVKLVPGGSHVKQGDLLVEFDRQAQLRDIIDKQAQAEDQTGKLLEAQAAESAARAKDETEMQTAQSALSKAELEMQKVELLSKIDAEKAREDLDEARATLAQLKETFDLKRKAAQASIRILEIQRDRTRETMLHAQKNAELMQIRAPIDGIVVLNSIWKQGTMGEVKEGDQVRPGVPFMQVVDPSVMQVHALVNQEDIVGVKVGQTARVHLDAYPEFEMKGRLESLDPMGQHGDFSGKLRKFTAIFSIQGSDPKLMPDLSAAVDVEGSAGHAEGNGTR